MLAPADESWVEIERYAQVSAAQGDALVLAAVGIASRLAQVEDRIGLFVVARDAARARHELNEYRRENPSRRELRLRPAGEGVDAALAYAAVLVVAFVADSRHLLGIDWSAVGFAGAGRILGGEWWRAFTALSLHADFGHLASNVVAGGVLGVLLGQALGPGLTWLIVFLAGGVGNAVNAAFQPAAHAAVGASTAVFAALGLLSALMWRRALPRWRRGLRRWLPLAAGVALLAFLGTAGERTDVGAHVAGFAVGVACGVVLHLAGSRLPAGRRAQFIYGAAAIALWGATWGLALANS